MSGKAGGAAAKKKAAAGGKGAAEGADAASGMAHGTPTWARVPSQLHDLAKLDKLRRHKIKEGARDWRRAVGRGAVADRPPLPAARGRWQ